MKNGNIKIHLGYVIVLLVMILIWLISYIFMDSNYAGSLLNFAGTITSIILAVLAIMVTLLDSSSQKHSINDIKESVSSLQDVTNELRVLLDEHNSNINNKIVEIGNYDNRISELTSTMISTLNKTVETMENDKDIEDIKQLTEKIKGMEKMIIETQEKKKGLIDKKVPISSIINFDAKYKYNISVKEPDEEKFDAFVKIFLDMLAVKGVSISYGSKTDIKTITAESPFSVTYDTIISLAKDNDVEIISLEKLS